MFFRLDLVTNDLQAIDLGMNRDSDKWKDGRGNDIFTPVEKQIRRQIWWSCCIADKYVFY